MESREWRLSDANLRALGEGNIEKPITRTRGRQRRASEGRRVAAERGREPGPAVVQAPESEIHWQLLSVHSVPPPAPAALSPASSSSTASAPACRPSLPFPPPFALRPPACRSRARSNNGPDRSLLELLSRARLEAPLLNRYSLCRRPGPALPRRPRPPADPTRSPSLSRASLSRPRGSARCPRQPPPARRRSSRLVRAQYRAASPASLSRPFVCLPSSESSLTQARRPL